jgi:hypothetical protein
MNRRGLVLSEVVVLFMLSAFAIGLLIPANQRGQETAERVKLAFAHERHRQTPLFVTNCHFLTHRASQNNLRSCAPQ